MPKITPIQNSFTAGILSPRLHSRSDIEAYRAGLSDAVNFVTMRHGPAETRDGMLYLSSYSGQTGKLLSFQLSPDSDLGEGFPVVINGTDLSIYGTTSAIAGTNVVANSDFSAGSASWNVIGKDNVRFTGSLARITADPVTYVGISQQIEVEQNSNHLIQVNSPTPAATIFPRVYVSVGTTKGGTDVLARTTSTSVAFDSGTNTTVWVNVELENGVFEDEFDPESRTIIAQGTPTRDVVSVSVRAPNQNSEQVSIPHPWSPEDVPNLKAVMTPNGNTMYILSGEITPYKLVYNVGTASWSLDPVSFTSAPGHWVDGSWPTTMTFFQGRSWWGGAAGKPANFVASKTGEYEDLTVGPNANDALDFDLSRRGLIRWMEGARNLLIGTTAGEYIITSAQGTITPNDVKAEQQSANGGSDVQSEPIGNLVLYASLDGRKLRSTSYQWNEQAWVSRDLTFVAEHLTQGDAIKEISFAKDPESIIWITTKNGAILGCTFEPFDGTLGWHRHNTDGTIVSTTVVRKKAGSFLYLLVLRDGVLNLEALDPQCKADSCAILYKTTPDNVVSDISHLANRKVSVLVDDAVHPDVTLDGNGSAVLEWEGTEIQVGLPFTCSLTTLTPDYGAMRGSAMTNTKRWNKIVARLYSSRSPRINGQAAPERSTETPMDSPEPYGDFDVSVKNVGWGDGKITISQELPVKTRISGIFGELNQENL